jgi:hypothetical protein
MFMQRIEERYECKRRRVGNKRFSFFSNSFVFLFQRIEMVDM